MRAPPELVVFSDLDGTLLDAETYSWDPAAEALAELRARRIPLVFCTSKTRAETEPLARALGLIWPLIVENGGAVLVPEGDGWRSHERGIPRAVLVKALGEIARETGASLQGFAGMSVAQVAELTGLSLTEAELAMQREYDEPFVLRSPEAEDQVARAARRHGLQVTRGGRFHHLMGWADKGRAVREVAARYGREVKTVGLGDAANDLPLLQAVHRPIVVPHPDGRVDEALAAALPLAWRAPRPGPAGWNEAVLAVLRGESLPAVGER